MPKAITLTPAQLAAMNPCNAQERLALFGKRKSMGAKQALAAGASIRDLLWVAGRLGHKDKCVAFALACAQRAVRPDSDPRVQACLDATGVYIADPSKANLKYLRVARSAAYAAYAAAYATATAAARQKEVKAQQAIFIDIFGGAA